VFFSNEASIKNQLSGDCDVVHNQYVTSVTGSTLQGEVRFETK